MIQISEKAIDESAVRNAVDDPGFGAILVFVGVGRNVFEGRAVLGLEYEVYAEMAVPVLQAIAAEISEKWPGTKVAIVHRTGWVDLGEASVVIAVGTPHREAAYDANRYAIEQLKSRVPIWKKECYADGSAWKANATAE